MPPRGASSTTVKRINREISDIQKEDLGAMKLAPTEENIYVWTGTIPGPEGSVYEGGFFDIEVILPQDYPFSAPKAMFKTKIYHMNISEHGNICIDILKGNWSPALSLFKLMLSLSSLLTDPNPRDPLVPSIATQYTRNRRLHDSTAREWTALYAKPKLPPRASAVPGVQTPSSTAPCVGGTSATAYAALAHDPAPHSYTPQERGRRHQPPSSSLRQPARLADLTSDASTPGSGASTPVVIDLSSDDDDTPGASASAHAGKRKRERVGGAAIAGSGSVMGVGAAAAPSSSSGSRQHQRQRNAHLEMYHAGPGGSNSSREVLTFDLVDELGDSEEDRVDREDVRGASAARDRKRRRVGAAASSRAGREPTVRGEVIVID